MRRWPRNRLEGNAQGLDLREASAQSFGVRTASTSDEYTVREVYSFCLPLGILAHKGPVKGPQPAAGQGLAVGAPPKHGFGLTPRRRTRPQLAISPPYKALACGKRWARNRGT